MKFFIDTANVDDIRKANDMGVICGVTTNPSLIAKEGRDFNEVIKEITSIVDGPISGEVKATTVDAEGMIKEGEELYQIDPQKITIKLPCTEDGIRAVKHFADKYGLNREVTRDELRQRIEDKTLLEVCNRVPVKPGDAFLIEAGTLHSIGGGITVAEIQQNSNTTYRVYDYGRLDKNGKPRELHVDKALDVVSLKPSPKPSALPPNLLFAEYDMKQLVSCEYFTVHEFNLHGRCHLLSDRSSFQSIMVLDGLMELECRTGYETLEKGASVFVPADYGEYWIRGNGKFLLTTV